VYRSLQVTSLLVSLLFTGSVHGESVYLSNGLNGSVYQFNTSAQRIRTITSPLLKNPEGLVVGAAGNVFVADDGGESISKITPGNVVTNFVTGLNHPCGLAIDIAGNLYVGDDELPLIQKISPQGVVTTFANNADGAESYSGLTFDASGNLYAADFNQGIIYKFSSLGAASIFASGLDSPEGLAFNKSGDLFVASFNASDVIEITPGGSESTFIPHVGGGMIGLAIDPSQNLYVSNFFGSSSILEYDQHGNFGPWVGSLGGDANYVAIALPEPTAVTAIVWLLTHLLLMRRPSVRQIA
jgi:DNA-binding beta-propeller fold protein YncE